MNQAISSPSEPSSISADLILSPRERQALYWTWRAQAIDELPPAVAAIVDRRRAQLEQSDNPLARAAYAILRGEPVPASQAALEPVVMEKILPDVYAYAPPDHLQRLVSLANKPPDKAAAAELLEQATGLEPVMVATFSHFEGEYPEEPDTRRECGEYTVGGGRGDAVTSLKRAVFELWRPVLFKKRGVVVCEHCIHQRILGFCNDIERVSTHYGQLQALRYLTVKTGDYPTLAGRIRKRNQRHEKQVTYTSFPLKTGYTVVLHDAPAWLGGAQLPAERAALYTLVSAWYEPPKGKRSAHGLSTWAKLGPGGEPLETKSKKKRGRKEEDGAPAASAGGSFKFWIRARYGYVARLVAEHLGESPGRRGMKLDMAREELFSLLDAAGIEYFVEGDVAVSTPDLKPGCTKVDKLPPDTAEEELDAMLGPPRPLFEAALGGAR